MACMVKAMFISFRDLNKKLSVLLKASFRQRQNDYSIYQTLTEPSCSFKNSRANRLPPADAVRRG